MKLKYILPVLLAALTAAQEVSAEVVKAKAGIASVDLSATQMSRIVVQGGKIVSVKSLDDPSGPQLLVQNDASSGDVYVGFDGETAGRTFSAFLTTEEGDTVQLLLHPGDGPARTVEIALESRMMAQVSPALRSPGYSETVAAFLKLMFNGQVAEGVSYEPRQDNGRTADRLLIRTLGYYHTAGLRGIVLLVTNKDSIPQTLNPEQFLVSHVVAAGISNELLQPGESARVYIAEEAE